MCTRECMCEWVCVCVCGLTHNAICWTRRGRRGGGWLRVSCELIRFKCESEVFTRQPLAARNYCLRIALIKSFCGRANYLSGPLSLSWLCPPPLSAAWLSIKFPGNGWHGKKLSARSEHRPGGVASALHRYSSGMFGMRTMHSNCKYLLVYFRQLYVARDALSCKSTLGRDLCKLVQLGSGICLAIWNCSKICEKLKNSLSTLAYIKVKPIERFFCISASPRQSCQHMFEFTCWKTA